MDNEYNFDRITLETFKSLLEQYADVVDPKLVELDKGRYETIPQAVQARKAGAASSHGLTKDELTTLVEWKLSHGTFRPSLKALVMSNSEKDVATCTGAAYQAIDPPGDTDGSMREAINEAKALKGIGPATASLILSVYLPDEMPFFSDELYQWAFWEANGAKGWQRPIKYTLKEYLGLVERVVNCIGRLKVPAVEIEKVAYVLGKRQHRSHDSDPGRKRKTAPGEASSRPAQKPKNKAQKTESAPSSTKAVRSSTRISAKRSD